MENWRPVPDAEEYVVSDGGTVMRRAHVREVNLMPTAVPPKRVEGQKRKDGYLQVRVGSKTRTVHSLVALAWLGPCPPGHVVDHVNGQRDDNRLVNLRYLPAPENVRVGKAAKLDRRAVERMVRKYRAGKATQADVAAAAGVSQQQASRVIRGKSRPNRGG